jgi:hypothetical protein
MSTWVKIDDSFPDHPKVIGLSDKAFRVHIEALCYCGRFLTDGFIPMFVISKFANNNMATVVELVDAELWREEPHNNGFRIHDYLAHQTSKSEVEQKRATTRERQKRYREKQKTTVEPAVEEGGDDGWDNALLTPSEYRVQNTEDRTQNTEYRTQGTESEKRWEMEEQGRSWKIFF